MSSLIQVSPYSESDAQEWDGFVARAPMATFLHKRSYPAYNRDRLQDTSLMIRDSKGRLVGVFPAAVDPRHERKIVSHPGITYGGVLHNGKLRGQAMLEALQAVTQFYSEQGFQLLAYKAIPYIYHQVPSSDDLYSLFRLGANRYRCDLSCAIDLTNRQAPSERRRRGLRNALKNGIKLAEGLSFVEAFWKVLEENLTSKYRLKPVHTLNEILLLHSRFPENIEFVVALLDSEVIGGVVLFESRYVFHSQYTASNAIGQKVCALDAVFERCLEKAMRQQARYFNFGVSTEDDGQYLNSDLYQFKAEFGAGGVIHEFYELTLKP